MSTVLTPTYGALIQVDTTHLANLVNSKTQGWRSALVSNVVLKASDFRVRLKFSGPPTLGSDNAVYVYLVPWTYDGTYWYPGSSLGTSVELLPTEGSALYIGSPNNIGNPLALVNSTITYGDMVASANLSTIFGAVMPHGFSFLVFNYTGGILGPANNTISLFPVTYVSI